MKKYTQAFLKRIGLYQRLKTSYAYDLYWTFANRRLIDDRDKEVAFYRKILEGFRKGNIIFDIGANTGYKTDIFLRLGAKVLAVDPDEVNQEVLRHRFLKYRLVPKAVSIEGKAVSDASTFKTMWIDTPGSAKNTLNRKWVEILKNDQTRFGQSFDFACAKQVETTTVANLMARYGVPFFVKIDVEGHEPSVLRGMNRPVRYLSFEVNLPEFKLEGLECIDILKQVAANSEFNYAVDCQRGLMFERWMRPREFARAFEQCREVSVEVFWRTTG